MALNALLGDSLGNALRLSPLKLAREQVAQPALEQGHNAAQEEQPYAPGRRPKSDAGALAHGARVEAVVNEVLQVLHEQKQDFKTVTVQNKNCRQALLFYFCILLDVLSFASQKDP